MWGRVEALVIFFGIIAPVGAMGQLLPEGGEWDREINLNDATEAELSECGLFTAFQIVSLLEYRELYGGVLSYGELSLIDGFTPQKVEDLLPFVTLGESPEIAPAGGNKISNKVILRPDFGRYIFKSGNKVAAGINVSQKGTSAYFQLKDVTLGRGVSLRNIVVGDYTVRMGQGLLVWNAFSLAGAGNPSSLLRRGNTIYPYSSNSPEGVFRGVAATLSWCRGLQTSLFYSEQGRPVTGGRVSFEMERWRGGINVTGLKNGEGDWTGGLSGDFILSFGGFRFFGELGLDREGDMAALLGAHLPVNERVECALMLRWYSEVYDAEFAGAYSSVSKCSNQRGLFYSVVWSPLESLEVRATGDVVHYPAPRYGVKVASFEYESSLEGELAIGDDMSIKGRWRYRYYGDSKMGKYGVRMEYLYRPDVGFYGGVKGEMVWHSPEGGISAPGLACYLEGGWKSPKGKFDVVLRGTLFRVDDWDDRIYFYERDLPQSFTVPALYRRGWDIYAYIKYAPLRRVGLYLKVSKKVLKGQISLTF